MSSKQNISLFSSKPAAAHAESALHRALSALQQAESCFAIQAEEIPEDADGTIDKFAVAGGDINHPVAVDLAQLHHHTR